jgi:subtilisin family serine protease
MATTSVQQQIERLLDETTSRTVSVIVQARENDRATKATASAAASALIERRLVGRPADIVRSGRGRRSGRSPSIAAAVTGATTSAGSKAAATATVQQVLATDAFHRAMARSGEDAASSPVTPLLAARSVAATLTRDELASLRDDPGGVVAVYPNRDLKTPRVIELDTVPAGVAEHRASAWGIERTGALAAWGAYNARGKGVKVGVLDTGVDADHPDLKGKVVNWAEFEAHGKRVTGSTPHDTDRHGTHVCGTIAGGNASGKWIGMAPEARLAVGLVLDGDKGGTDAQALAGIDWALERNVDVISMSLGALVIGPETPGTYTRAIVDCFLRGVAVVTAMGNDGDGTGGSPGSDLFALSVGAVDVDDLVAGFSSGRTQIVTESDVIRPGLLPLAYPKPDLSAPGVAVESSVPGSAWALLSGTSMATPHATGAIAVLLSATGRLMAVEERARVGALVDLMTASVRELGEAGQDHRYGFGAIDVLRAIGMAKEQGR